MDRGIPEGRAEPVRAARQGAGAAARAGRTSAPRDDAVASKARSPDADSAPAGRATTPAGRGRGLEEDEMRQIEIFDTTLRDGEQAPGAALTAAAKLEVARALADLGVDVIEAGFPAASDGEAAAVRHIAQEVTGVTMA